MTSPQQAAANRLNAMRSTGPRTTVGKDRARRNALRHGLATALSLDPGWGPQIEALARAMSGDFCANGAVLAAARMAAEAELDLVRVRRVRFSLLEKLASLTNEDGQTDQPSAVEPDPERIGAESAGSKLFAAKGLLASDPWVGLIGILGELSQIERYERRASSRRNKRLRLLNTVRQESAAFSE